MINLTNFPQPDANLGLSDAAFNLRRLILGHVVARAVQVAAELDLANHLKEGGKDCAELAILCSAHATTLTRVMRMLVSVGVFAENNGRFSNNEVSELLRSDVPQSMRALARMFGADFQWSSVQALMHSVQTGEPRFQYIFGEELFSYTSVPTLVE